MITEFVIDRNVWGRGGEEGGYLLSTPCNGSKMCCLGIFLEACGVDRDALLNNSEPRDLFRSIPEGARWLVNYLDSASEFDPGSFDPRYSAAPDIQPQDVRDVMAVNDADDISETERERKTAAFFAAHGITVTFTGDYYPETNYSLDNFQYFGVPFKTEYVYKEMMERNE